jgi:TorA maturation chaperone TorD
MRTVAIPQITERLQKLPADKLAVVYDFVSYLVERETRQAQEKSSEAFQTMLASEAVLRRDWDRPEEDKAWADL